MPRGDESSTGLDAGIPLFAASGAANFFVPRPSIRGKLVRRPVESLSYNQ
jgi:hypothetical protein